MKEIAVHNRDVADVFNQIADLLELQEANAFRIRAYRSAARTVEDLPQEIAELADDPEKLTALPGIGKDLAGKIQQIVRTGTLPLLEDLKKQMPSGLTDLMQIQGLGAKKIARMYRDLRIQNLNQLRKAAEQGKIRELKGFGQKTEQSILEETRRLTGAEHRRLRLDRADSFVIPLADYLRQEDAVDQIVIAGSYRRRMETIGDVDILASGRKPERIMDRFLSYREIRKVLASGKAKSTVILSSGLQADLRVIPPASFGAALLYFTGSKAHNIELRKIALAKRWKINEYGLYRGARRLAGRTEEEIYKRIGLDWIPPELRENRGEIEAARAHTLPDLVTLDDIRGDLHVHTNYTDGDSTIDEIAEAAARRGYDYIAITDHSQSLSIAGGLKPKELEQQIRQIDEYNRSHRKLRLLKGAEVDILKDGTIDFPDEVLRKLDLRVCSVHTGFKLPIEQQTQRVIRAMKNPYFDIFAHPTGRILGGRKGYDIDMEKIMRAAREYGCALELNANADRLDLNDRHCRMARDLGVPVVISTDTHSPSNLDFMRWGIDQARRGWLEPKNVLNTRSARDLLAFFGAKRRHST
jgi:DNA polymerase (family 10)